MKGTRLRLAAVPTVAAAAAVLALAGLGGGASSSATAHRATAHQTPRPTHAATQRIPLSKSAWQQDMTRVHAPGTGCFTASYPALVWHQVKCGKAPNWPT